MMARHSCSIAIAILLMSTACTRNPMDRQSTVTPAAVMLSAEVPASTAPTSKATPVTPPSITAITPYVPTTTTAVVDPGTSAAPPVTDLTAIPIVYSQFDPENPQLRRVVGALWSTDGVKLYYAFTTSTTPKVLTWSAFDVVRETSEPIDSPFPSDVLIWPRLAMSDPTETLAVYPSLQGYVSDDGNQVIYAVSTGDCAFGSATTAVVTANARTLTRSQLLSMPRCAHIGQAAWLDNDSRVVFDLRGEGSSELFLADLIRGSAQPLDYISGFTGTTMGTWQLSPDERMLAIADFDTLKVLDLRAGSSLEIEQLGDLIGNSLAWSPDSTVLYYWRAKSDGTSADIRRYDFASGSASTWFPKIPLSRQWLPLPDPKTHHYPS
jgi:hypothetical protein